MYIADLAGTFATSTIRRRLTAIRKAHRLAEKPDPVSSPMVKEVLDGILREYGAFQRGKNPLRSTDLMAMLDCLSDDVASQRNRAILLIGFAGAFRRAELTSLDCEDLDFRNEGVVVTIRRSKTDQYGKGERKGIPRGRSTATCPVAALENWLRAAGITTGAVFRPVTKSGSIRDRRLTDRSIALIIKKFALKAGLDATKYAGHSLRSGLATEAAYQGASERSIMKQGGWKSASMARRYIREGSLFHDNAGNKLGL
jgi:integrase